MVPQVCVGETTPFTNIWFSDGSCHSSGADCDSANNFPLRGGKYSDFEGGVRVRAFVNGGYLPSAMRGSQVKALMSVADFWATFAGLAGVDTTDQKASRNGLPPIDSIDMWPVISGE